MSQPLPIDIALLTGLSQGLQVAFARPQHNSMGNRTGLRAGEGLEFHDYRDYQAGDDPRHLDWGVWARSRTLMVRTHRHEEAARIDIVLDASASMDFSPEKWRRARQVAALSYLIAVKQGRSALWVLGGNEARRLGPDALQQLNQLPTLPGARGLAQVLPNGLQAARLLISDGLCVEGATTVLARCAALCRRVALVEILGNEERDPQHEGQYTLVACEGGSRTSLVQASLRAAYRQRLQALQADWDRALSWRGPGRVSLSADTDLTSMVRALVRGRVFAAEKK